MIATYRHPFIVSINHTRISISVIVDKYIFLKKSNIAANFSQTASVTAKINLQTKFHHPGKTARISPEMETIQCTKKNHCGMQKAKKYVAI